MKRTGQAAAAEPNEEAILVAQAAERDPAAIRTLIQRYNRRLYRIARSILRNDAEAEDAVQSGYLHAFRSLGDFHGQSSFATWLTRIVMNEALQLLRRRRPPLEWDGSQGQASLGGQVVLFPTPTCIDPERGMAQRQIHAALERAIGDLPDDFRRVLVARVIEQMSVEDTAELLGIRQETVKTRLYRARRMLRDAMERQIGPLLVDAFPFDGERCDRMTETVLKALGRRG